jgi:hypothetical protein
VLSDILPEEIARPQVLPGNLLCASLLNDYIAHVLEITFAYLPPVCSSSIGITDVVSPSYIYQLYKKHVSKQGGCTEKPVAAIPKSISSHDCIPSEDFTFSELLLIRCTAQRNSIALSGFEDICPVHMQ